MSTVLSVNVGRVRTVGPVRSGIDKRPVDGPVAVAAPGPRGHGGSGLAGDDVWDLRHHGGDDQAVYVYAREDLDDWSADLGRPLASGSFGENLTTAGVDVSATVVGEQWQVGDDLLLEVSDPRIPCRTFADFLAERRWVRRFTERAAPGTYLRVLRPGPVRAGDPIRVVLRPDHGVTVRTAFRALTTAPQLLPLLGPATQLSAEVRDLVRRRVPVAMDADAADPEDPGPEDAGAGDTDAGADRATGRDAGVAVGDER
ncbi:MOSC domain-containing protein [Nakamurella endophytica]|nr:MOSC domain-containing protein [Nakamurella endophytica]